jgi:hypothetical protein
MIYKTAVYLKNATFWDIIPCRLLRSTSFSEGHAISVIIYGLPHFNAKFINFLFGSEVLKLYAYKVKWKTTVVLQDTKETVATYTNLGNF